MTRHDQWVYLDNFKRKLVIKTEIKRKILKSLQKNFYLTTTERIFISIQKSFLPNQGSLNKVRNRCLTTGRVRNVQKRIKGSRFIFRKSIYNSLLPGGRRYTR